VSNSVHFERPAPGVGRLRWSNPDRRNALDLERISRMQAELAAAARDPELRVLILQGEGPWFCSGFDLTHLPAAAAGNPIEAAAAVEALMSAVEDFPLPVVAAMRGPTMGAGGELAAAADLRIAGDDLAFAMPPARIGLVYHEAGLARFLRLVGSARTREIFLTAARFDAARALAVGLVDRVVPADSLDSAALALAVEMAALAPLSLKGSKRILRLLEGAAMGPHEHSEIATLRAQAADSKDHVEGLRAVAEKRKPRFSGS
jgi:enoyl-CoA hydratase/carnithine racemase